LPELARRAVMEKRGAAPLRPAPLNGRGCLEEQRRSKSCGSNRRGVTPGTDLHPSMQVLGL